MATLLVRQSEIWEGVLSKHLVRAAANLAATKIRSSFPKIRLICLKTRPYFDGSRVNTQSAGLGWSYWCSELFIRDSFRFRHHDYTRDPYDWRRQCS